MLTMLILSLLALIAGDPTGLTARDHIASPRVETPTLYFPITDRQALAAKKGLLAYLPVPHPGAQIGMSGTWSEGWRPRISEKIGTYQLLYAGVKMSWKAPGEGRMSAAGARQIRITGICDDIANDMRSVFADAIINDGGECIFTAFFDPVQKRIVHFSVNGIA
jgi:hypothetical protein